MTCHLLVAGSEEDINTLSAASFDECPLSSTLSAKVMVRKDRPPVKVAPSDPYRCAIFLCSFLSDSAALFFILQYF